MSRNKNSDKSVTPQRNQPTKVTELEDAKDSGIVESNDHNEGASTIADNQQGTNEAQPVAEFAKPANNPEDPGYVPNTPTERESGFTPGEGTSHTPPQEVSGLTRMNYDEAMKLQAALETVNRYRTGSAYRHDFESAMETLRTFGYTFDTERTDKEAVRVQEEMLNTESSAG